MNRSLSLGGVGLLVLVLAASAVFGKPPTMHKPLHTSSKPQTHSSTHSTSRSKIGGSKATSKKKKLAKPKATTKSGNKKKNRKHKNRHKKHQSRKQSGNSGSDGNSVPDLGNMGGSNGGGNGGGNGGSDSPDGDDDSDQVEDGSRGLQITDLDEDGPAADAGLDVDDTIISVNGVRVQSPEELRAAFKSARGPVQVVYISDETGDVEDVTISPRNGRVGIVMDEVTLSS